MNSPMDTIRNDHVLQEVMRKHGLHWDDFVARSDDDTLYLPCVDPQRPSIEIDYEWPEWSLKISWNLGGKVVRYDLEREGAIVTVKDTQLPDATLAGLSGKTANTVIELPGFDGLMIDIAVLSKAFVSDPLDLRMSVENAE